MLPFGPFLSLFPALLLSAIWGTLLAAFIQWTKFGQFLAVQQAWAIVALYLGGMFGIGFLLTRADGMVSFWLMFLLFGVGAAPLVLRSAYAHYLAWADFVNEQKRG